MYVGLFSVCVELFGVYVGLLVTQCIRALWGVCRALSDTVY